MKHYLIFVLMAAATVFSPGPGVIMTLFNLGPDRVRQLSEQTVDGGKTWSTQYDFIYIRKN